MTTVFLDAECDNLLPYVRKIWCVSVLDASGECVTYTDRESFLKASKEWTTIVFHNGLGYDLWVLLLVWGIPFTVGKDTFNGRDVRFIDTLVLSRYQNPDRIFGHGLRDWGEFLDFEKLPHKDFSCYSDDMRVYCENDVKLTKKVYEYLLEEQKT